MKQKTKKSISKKVRITGTGKLRRRHTGQNHYNTHETGGVTRDKRGDLPLFKTDAKNIARAIPYA